MLSNSKIIRKVAQNLQSLKVGAIVKLSNLHVESYIATMIVASSFCT